MPSADLGDIQICYDVAGSGPRVLFISGTGGDLRHRPGVFDGPLPSHFEVLAYDQRGLGRTSKPPGPYTMAEYADDAAALLGRLGWDRTAVVGVSFGGMVAQEHALRHPERVERLVLACTSSGGGGGASYPLHELASLEGEERIRRTLAIADRSRDEAWQREHPEEVEAMIRFARERQPPTDDPEAQRGATLQLEARRGHDTWARLAGLRVPTLVCGGRGDGIAPQENQEALAARIPGARLEFFDGGHYFLLQDRRASPTIVDFLLER